MVISRRELLKGGSATVFLAWLGIGAPRISQDPDKRLFTLPRFTGIEQEIYAHYRNNKARVRFWTDVVMKIPDDKCIFWDPKNRRVFEYNGKSLLDQGDEQEAAKGYFKRKRIKPAMALRGKYSRLKECLEMWPAVLPHLEQSFKPSGTSYFASVQVPMDFIDNLKSESLGNPRAESSKGARGIWQFMYWTGKKYGLNVDNKFYPLKDERCGTKKPTKAAHDYLSDLTNLVEYWKFMLECYVMGEGKLFGNLEEILSKDGKHKHIEKIIEKRGKYVDYYTRMVDLVARTEKGHPIRSFFDFYDIDPDFNILYDSLINHLETKEKPSYMSASYIDRFVAYWLASRHPEEFGFHDLNYVQPFELETVEVDGGIDLRKLASFLNVDQKKMRMFNGEYFYEFTPFTSNKFAVNVPKNQATALLMENSYNSQQLLVEYRDYLVRSDDTRGTIADKFGVKINKVISRDRVINAKHNITEGETLSVIFK